MGVSKEGTLFASGPRRIREKSADGRVVKDAGYWSLRFGKWEVPTQSVVYDPLNDSIAVRSKIFGRASS